MKDWNIQKTQFKVADFVNWRKNSELNLSPMFQRRAVWSKGAKSYLLDTILRGLPVPPIILRDLPPDVDTFKSVREVVDGQQRLRTLLAFITPQTIDDYDVNRDKFTISKSHNRELAGKAFRDLPRDYQQRILNYQFMVHIFPSETDDRDILEIFARMNATGTKLNNQELRNAEYFGEFKTQSFALAAEHLNYWLEWKLFSEEAIARMKEVEFTSELMILVIKGIQSNTKRIIDSHYRDLEEEFKGRGIVTRRVRYVLKVMNDHFHAPEFGALSVKGIVYPLFASLYHLSYGLNAPLTSAKPHSISKKKISEVIARTSHILNESAPDNVLRAFDARSSQSDNRKVITKYLK